MITKNSKFNIIRSDLFCSYCGKQCKNLNSLNNHERLCLKNTNRKYISYTQGKPGWNKGLTKETDERVLKGSLSRIESNKNRVILGHKHTDKEKKHLSNLARENDFQSHFGSRKSYSYAGVKFISSYELKVAKSLDANCIR